MHYIFCNVVVNSHAGHVCFCPLFRPLHIKVTSPLTISAFQLRNQHVKLKRSAAMKLCSCIGVALVCLLLHYKYVIKVVIWSCAFRVLRVRQACHDAPFFINGIRISQLRNCSQSFQTTFEPWLGDTSATDITLQKVKVQVVFRLQ